jgi:phospholipid/cholesterol/gamma-HCH transport system substrate-binding protein
METRASHLAIGAFVMVLIFGGLGFVIWHSKHAQQVAMVSHYTRFAGSVQGLQVGTDVLFGGIPIGQVTAVDVDPQEPSLARIDMRVSAEAPIRTDSVATMQMLGFTGREMVEISRGTADGQMAKNGSEIPAGYTAFERLMNGTPELVAKGSLLFDRLAEILSDENIAATKRIMANVQKFIALEGTNSTKVGTTLDRAAAAAAQISKTNAGFRQLAGDMRAAGGRLGQQADVAARDIRTLASFLGNLADSLNKIFDDNRQPIHEFTTTGLYELPAMIVQVQLVVQTFKRIKTEVERDPERFFFQDRQSGFQAQ